MSEKTVIDEKWVVGFPDGSGFLCWLADALRGDRYFTPEMAVRFDSAEAAEGAALAQAEQRAYKVLRESEMLPYVPEHLRVREVLPSATEQKGGTAAVGSDAVLASTVDPGEGFGRFAIPASSRECLQHLMNGTPIEVPRLFYPVLMNQVQAWFGEAIIDTKLDAKIAQLTPISCRLNEAGKRVLANVEGDLSAPGANSTTK
jgi:hypothetical protein